MSGYPVAAWDGWEIGYSPVDPPCPPTYVVVFCRRAGGFLLANIPGRGWTTPSGRIESGESAEDAARRECHEEVGAEVGALLGFGHFFARRDGETRVTATFVTQAERLGALPTGTESLGRRLAILGELPGLYAGWNPLFERLFAEAATFNSARLGTSP